MNVELQTKISSLAAQVVAQNRPTVTAEETVSTAKQAVVTTNTDERSSSSAESRKSTESVGEQLRALADQLNVSTASISRKLKFQFVDDANISVIQVFDRETDQLIRQIPSEEVVARLENGDQDFLQLIDTTA